MGALPIAIGFGAGADLAARSASRSWAACSLLRVLTLYITPVFYPTWMLS